MDLHVIQLFKITLFLLLLPHNRQMFFYIMTSFSTDYKIPPNIKRAGIHQFHVFLSFIIRKLCRYNKSLGHVEIRFESQENDVSLCYVYYKNNSLSQENWPNNK